METCAYSSVPMPKRDRAPAPRDKTNLLSPQLRTTIARGFSKLTISTAASKLLAFAGQIALGRILLKTDFGLFAIASGVTLLLRAFQDAGIREVLVQLGDDDLHRFTSPLFWFATAVNLVTALALLLIARPVSDLYDHAEVAGLLELSALWIAISSPWAYFTARLWRDMRFGRLAIVNVTWAAIQYGGAVILALADFGAASFVAPMPVAAVVCGALGGLLVREQPWRGAPRWDLWRELVGRARWIVLGSLAFAVFLQGDYLVLGAFLPVAPLGVYFFAYQLSSQLGVLFGSNLHGVLFPALSRLTESPESRARAVIRALSVLSAALSGLCLLFAAVFPSLENILWSGRWDAAVVPLQFLAVGIPLRGLFDVANAALMAQGEFRRLSLFQLAQGFGLMVVAAGASEFFDDVPAITAVISAYVAASGVVFTAMGVRTLGISAGALLKATLPQWLCGVGAFLLCKAAYRYLDSLPEALTTAVLAVLYVTVWIALTAAFARESLRVVLDYSPAAISTKLKGFVDLASSRRGG